MTSLNCPLQSLSQDTEFFTLKPLCEPVKEAGTRACGNYDGVNFSCLEQKQLAKRLKKASFLPYPVLTKSCLSSENSNLPETKHRLRASYRKQLRSRQVRLRVFYGRVIDGVCLIPTFKRLKQESGRMCTLGYHSKILSPNREKSISRIFGSSVKSQFAFCPCNHPEKGGTGGKVILWVSISSFPLPKQPDHLGKLCQSLVQPCVRSVSTELSLYSFGDS